jgi:TolB protein
VALVWLGALPAAANATFPGGNGNLVVASDPTCREGAPHLWGLSISGRRLGPLTPPCSANGPEQRAFAPDWSPNGQRLVFVQWGDGPQQLVTIAADGSDRRAIPGTDGATAPSFAPDGNHVAFAKDGSLWTVALDGHDRKLLYAPAACPSRVRQAPSCTSLETPRWSPDGRRIAFVATTFSWGGGARPHPRAGIWMMNARTAKLLWRVSPTDISAVGPASDTAQLDWSPNGRRLVFRTPYQEDEQHGGASGGNIWIVSARGHGLRRLVHRERFAETTPRWSPDGRFIAWIGLRFGAGQLNFSITPTVWRIRATGGQRKRVRTLTEVEADEGFYDELGLTWQPQTASPASRSVAQGRHVAMRMPVSIMAAEHSSVRLSVPHSSFR